jgi:biopolymer transport protein ExbD
VLPSDLQTIWRLFENEYQKTIRESAMNFRRRPKDEPEINLIPFIDVLLVILIFLMLSTTYSKFTELQIKLPTADVDKQRDYPKEMIVSVSADGRYTINKTVVNGSELDALAAAMHTNATAGKETVVIISADAAASHQAVVAVMEAARRAGLAQLTFATQTAAGAEK